MIRKIAAAATTALIALTVILTAITATTTPQTASHAASQPSHVVVCNLYVSHAAMVANQTLNITPTTASFCVEAGN